MLFSNNIDDSKNKDTYGHGNDNAENLWIDKVVPLEIEVLFSSKNFDRRYRLISDCLVKQKCRPDVH